MKKLASARIWASWTLMPAPGQPAYDLWEYKGTKPNPTTGGDLHVFVSYRPKGPPGPVGELYYSSEFLAALKSFRPFCLDTGELPDNSPLPLYGPY